MPSSAASAPASPPSPPPPPPPAAAAATTAAGYPSSDSRAASDNRHKRKRSVSVSVPVSAAMPDHHSASPISLYPPQPAASSRPSASRQDERVDPQIQQQQQQQQQQPPPPQQQQQQQQQHQPQQHLPPPNPHPHPHHVDQDSIPPFPTPAAYPSIERSPELSMQTSPSAAPANQPWDGYDAATQLANHAQLAQNMDSADAQLAEVLQRDVQDPPGGPASNPPSSSNTTNPQNPPSADQSLVKYPVAQPRPDDPTDVDLRKMPNYAQRQPAVQQIGPKRKRVFSNRTKTGCLTCRRRKKKCDEAHPSCNNCIRGGFLCEGYSSSRTWQKPSSAKPQAPIQSREGVYHDDSAAYSQELSPQRQDRPRPASPSHPAGDQSKPQEYHDAMRDIPHPSTAKSGLDDNASTRQVATSSAAQEHSRNFPAAQARMALSMESHVTTAASQSPGFDTASQTANGIGDQSEKEKMMSGEPYRPYDPLLVRHRERCRIAIHQYANARNPLNGVSREEQTRLLQQIFRPSFGLGSQAESDDPSATLAIGHLGSGTIIEPSFNCHYGYNVHIGENVYISENCLLADDCSISIGAHTWIGPNVTILSSMAMGGMQERKGSQSRYQGRPVVIAEDCWIGANVTIMPGVTLGRGAYIASGEVVTSQILGFLGS